MAANAPVEEEGPPLTELEGLQLKCNTVNRFSFARRKISMVMDHRENVWPMTFLRSLTFAQRRQVTNSNDNTKLPT